MAEQFQFGVDYQKDLLTYTVQDEAGYKALNLYKDSYFTLLEHQILAHTIKQYFQREKRIPIHSLCKEEFLKITKDPKYGPMISRPFKNGILDLIDNIYNAPLRDPEAILKQCKRFASYIEFKEALEEVNIQDFDQYSLFVERATKAIRVGQDEDEKDSGQWLIEDIKYRQLDRQISPPVVPTPFHQLNAITNAGGFIKGSILVILDKPKNLKTFFLINLAREYLKMKKNIFIADFENGRDELFLRSEQSISRKDKREVLSGEYDKDIQKLLRKYKRLGGDIYIKRYSHRAKFRDIQADFDEIYRTTGKKFKVLITDYMALMSSNRNLENEADEISEIYKEASDFAIRNEVDHVWTAHHIKREAESRESSRYKDIDIAKCIDIVRHVQGIFGLNRSEEDKENSRARLEVVAIRDGLPNGRAYFHTDVARQRVVEFTKNEVRLLGEEVSDASSPTPAKRKKKLDL